MNVLKWKNFREDTGWYLTFVNSNMLTGKEGHSHDFAEVFLSRNQNIIHVINGQKIELLPGTLVMIRPDDNHYYIVKSQKTLQDCIINLAFPVSILDEMRKRFFSDKLDFWGGGGTIPEHLQLTFSDSEKLYNWFRELLFVQETRMELEWFLLNMLHMTQKNTMQTTEQIPDWLKNACEQMRKKQNMQLGLSKFFSLCGRCREHASRELTKYTSLSPSEYVNKIRINYAARLLSSTSQTINEIAYECGFNNLTHFYSNFKKYQGSSPRAYRQENSKSFVLFT